MAEPKPKIYVVEYGTSRDRYEKAYVAPSGACKFAADLVQDYIVRARWFSNEDSEKLTDMRDLLRHVDITTTRREFSVVVDTYYGVTLTIFLYKKEKP